MAIAADAPRDSGGWPARFYGECSECYEKIIPGELVHYVNNELCHALCDTEVDRLADTPPCEQCFTIPTAVGICMCDD